MAPPELSSTAQGLLSSVQWGLGGGCGAILGGVIYHAEGPRVMFQFTLGLALLGAGLVGLMIWRQRHRAASAAMRKASAATAAAAIALADGTGTLDAAAAAAIQGGENEGSEIIGGATSAPHATAALASDSAATMDGNDAATVVMEPHVSRARRRSIVTTTTT